MSIALIVTVWCDAPDCREFREGGDHRASHLRSELKRQGWAVYLPNDDMRRVRRDLCPVHAGGKS